MRRIDAGAAVAATLVLCAAPAALADESRERMLEERLREVESRLAQVEDRGGYFTATSDLAARVSELERAVLADDKGGFTSYFKQGMRSETGDGAHKYQWYGRIQNDWVWWKADNDLESGLGEEINGGTEFRRVRLGARGSLYGNIEFKSEIDFADAGIEFADVYMELVNCSFGSFRVGHFDEPMGLDRLTSSRFATFTERNLVAEGFAAGRNTGMSFQGTAAEDTIAWAVGMFRDADDGGNDVGNEKAGEYNLTGRISGRPVIEDDGATFLHLGAWLSLRDYSNDEVRFRARPNVHLGPRFVDTSTISDATDGTVWGIEAAWNSGPFCIQGEYAKASPDVETGSDPSFDAFSIEASYFLTGESKAYDRKKGAFDRPKVKKNYGDGDGTGAWQLGLRYDSIDLEDAGIDGGEMDTLTFGVNWYLNPNTRVSLNVVDIDVENDAAGFSEDGRALVMRFQVDF